MNMMSKGKYANDEPNAADSYDKGYEDGVQDWQSHVMSAFADAETGAAGEPHRVAMLKGLKNSIAELFSGRP